MKRNALKVILLANWGLGAEILKWLLHQPEVEIPLVVTQMDPDSPDPWCHCVCDLALEKRLLVFNQDRLTCYQLARRISEARVDLLLTHAYMKILPPTVFSIPPLGSINIHASLLPKYRGPAPLYWALKNKETDTGLTSHYIDEGIDTGDIIDQIKIPIDSGDTMDTLLEKQKTVIADLLSATFDRLRTLNFRPQRQDRRHAVYAPKVKAGTASAVMGGAR